MDAFESNRRDFLKKLGLITGTLAISNSVLPEEITKLIADKKEKYAITPEQASFMVKYEKWLEEFRSMAKVQKNDRDDMENNKKLMALSDEAATWQKELVEYMKDENFARYFMIASEHVTTVI
jgi:hypothetical protein